MIIRSVELQDYRNYGSGKLEFLPGTNLLYGDNAQGKTNILESIFFCATGKSHRGTRDKEMILFGKDEAHIKLIAEKQGVPHRIDVHLKAAGRKGIAIDGLPLKKAVDMFGVIHVILFAPEDLSIIKNAPSERRSFLDLELCQLDRIYTYNLINYNKAVAQKNKLLKQIEQQPSLADTLDIWNQQLINYGLPVIRKRREFIERLNSVMGPVHAGLTGGEEQIELVYVPNSSEEEFEHNIRTGRARETGACMSLFGPHRDDMTFEIGGIDVRHFGSQGQQRTAALSMKLAEIELVKQMEKDTPVLLLDDVLSELDVGRQRRLLQSIDGIQTIITDTGMDGYSEYDFHIDKIFRIVKGAVTEESTLL